MWTDLDLLRKMIDPRSISEVQTYNGKTQLILMEKANGHSEPYSVEIQGLPTECVAIKSDKFRAQREFFTNKNGQLRRSDYILVALKNDQCWAVFIELKKTKSSPRHVVEQQLKGSQCLLDYCRSLGKNFWHKESFLDLGENRTRFVCIRESNLRKRPSRIAKSRRKDCSKPENMFVLDGPIHNFKRLLEF